MEKSSFALRMSQHFFALASALTPPTAHSLQPAEPQCKHERRTAALSSDTTTSKYCQLIACTGGGDLLGKSGGKFESTPKEERKKCNNFLNKL